MHGDHCFGLPSIILHYNEGVISQRAKKLHYSKSKKLNERYIPPTLKIYGPEGLYNFIAASLKFSRSNLSVIIDVHEFVKRKNTSRDKFSSTISPDQPIPAFKTRNVNRIVLFNDENDHTCWTIPNNTAKPSNDRAAGEIKIKAVEIKHTIPCFGYVFEVITIQ